MAEPAEPNASLAALLKRHNIPNASNSVPPPKLECCCGRSSCAFLDHNNAALDRVEQDVRMAAQLGQAILLRHEKYMVDAERERKEMVAKIEKLESDKKCLEEANKKSIAENRGLLEHLEDLNTTVAESESHVKALEATLSSTNQELRRLESLASRTFELEHQLAVLEQEQDTLRQTVCHTEAEERSALARWRAAERKLCDLQDQLERIEQEAREERERHAEVIARMERQRAVEKELDTAAGRLKGAAAAKSMGTGKTGSSVVSHFVKDILQDNANLQMGIVELREMLMNSNDEVEVLREQLMMHQSVVDTRGENEGPPTLSAELAPKKQQDVKQPVVNQELHIHHHYHPVAKEEPRRLRRKRPLSFTPGSSQSSRAPSRGHSRQLTPLSTDSAILSQTSTTVPMSAQSNRWSVQSLQSGHASDFAPSSVPSSPQSMYRSSAMFDRHHAFDSSRPTSPTSSVEPLSPVFKPFHRKRGSEHSVRSFVTPAPFQATNIIHEEEDADLQDLEQLDPIDGQSRVAEEGDDEISPTDETIPSMPSHDSDAQSNTDDTCSQISYHAPTLRRTTSHESILSISGIDIHTLKSRPSQLTISGSGAYIIPRTRLGAGNPTSSVLSTEPVLNTSPAHAYPALSRANHSSTNYLRSNFTAQTPSGDASSSKGLSRKLTGWSWNKWGATPTSSAGDLRSRVQENEGGKRTVSAPITVFKATASRALSSTSLAVPANIVVSSYMGRSPGINQSGPIPGFKVEKKAPSQVKPVSVDTEALKEVLENE